MADETLIVPLVAIEHDPNAETWRGRFKSDGTRVFVSDGDLCKNGVENDSGWFFTRSGDAYVAIRAAVQGYQITNRAFTWPDRKIQEAERKDRHYLELEDMWAPIVIQMGRARDYENFHAFQESVMGNRFEYGDGKLTYASEANITYEYWTKGAQLPHINGTAVNLNPPKIFDSPFLSMEDGSCKAVISSPGQKELTLDFEPHWKTTGQQDAAG